ncbi:MAG: hypothetical protein PHU85_18540, partial [Phycisphaerae bacterium]|nr:hypothetical protein [Phycisphaerae bacterium]
FIPNNNPAPPNGPHPFVKYTNQVEIAGWRCNYYKGGGSHDVPMEGPTLTSMPRIFDYKTARGIQDKQTLVQVIYNTRRDITLEIETGMVVRSP